MSDYAHENRKAFRLTNPSENMDIWIANGRWGLHFSVDGRMYGGVVTLPIARYRYKLLKLGKRAVTTGWIKPEDR
jgi:hypothetical protein